MLAKAALSISATWSGPSVALTPNVTIVSAISRIRTTIGAIASSRLGGLGEGSLPLGEPMVVHHDPPAAHRLARVRAHPRESSAHDCPRPGRGGSSSGRGT